MAAFQKLLQVGEFSREEKRKGKTKEAIASIYWSIMTVIYLVWSFLTGDWATTWIIWPAAGVLFGAIAVFCDIWLNKKEEL